MDKSEKRSLIDIAAGIALGTTVTIGGFVARDYFNDKAEHKTKCVIKHRSKMVTSENEGEFYVVSAADFETLTSD